MSSSLSTNTDYLKLKQLFDTGKKDLKLVDLFTHDPLRFEKYSRKLATPDGEILFDFSKNLIDEEVFRNLLALVRKSCLPVCSPLSTSRCL